MHKYDKNQTGKDKISYFKLALNIEINKILFFFYFSQSLPSLQRMNRKALLRIMILEIGHSLLK